VYKLTLELTLSFRADVCGGPVPCTAVEWQHYKHTAHTSIALASSCNDTYCGCRVWHMMLRRQRLSTTDLTRRQTTTLINSQHTTLCCITALFCTAVYIWLWYSTFYN